MLTEIKADEIILDTEDNNAEENQLRDKMQQRAREVIDKAQRELESDIDEINARLHHAASEDFGMI